MSCSKCRDQNVAVKKSLKNNIAGQKSRAQNVARTLSIVVLASIYQLDVSFEILSYQTIWHSLYC